MISIGKRILKLISESLCLTHFSSRLTASMQHWRAPNLSFLSGNGHCIRTQLPSIRRLESTQLRFIKRISTRQSLAFNTSTIAKCPSVDFKDDYVYHALALSPLDVPVSDVVTKQESFFLVELSQSFIEALHSTAGLPWWAALSVCLHFRGCM